MNERDEKKERGGKCGNDEKGKEIMLNWTSNAKLCDE